LTHATHCGFAVVLVSWRKKMVTFFVGGVCGLITGLTTHIVGSDPAQRERALNFLETKVKGKVFWFLATIIGFLVAVLVPDFGLWIEFAIGYIILLVAWLLGDKYLF